MNKNKRFLTRVRVACFLRFLRALLIVFLIACLYVVIVQTDGICVDEGCEISFDASSLYIALGMTALDSVLVCLFSSRLYRIIHQLEKQETTNVCMAAEWKQFKFQLLCMSVVLISCVMDEVLHYMYIDITTFVIYKY